MTIIHHVSLGTNDYKKAVKFYDAVLAPLGYERVMTLDEYSAAAYGEPGGAPCFWIGGALDGEPATTGNGVHICFTAPTQEAVNAFHAKVLKMGGSDDGAPGPRPHYGEQYYGGFVRDPDGNKIEAVCFS